MEEVTDFKELEKIGRAISSDVRNQIISLLKKENNVSLYRLSQLLNMQITSLKNHCRILADEGIVEMKREGKKYVIRLKKIPHVYIEEV